MTVIVTDRGAAPYPAAMRYLAAVFVLAACASDPAPAADAGADAVAVDTGAEDAGATDAGQLDTGAPDAGAAEDVSPASDADASAVDAGQDAGQLDAGPEDTGAVDAGQDAGRDVGVDVPRDVGVDAGPVTYDLEAERTGLEVRVVYRVVGRGGQTVDCTSPPTSASCSVTESDNTLRFNVGSCGDARLVGLVPLGRSGRLVQMLYTGNVTNVVDPPLRRGAVRGGRQSFHIQASATPTTQGEGVAGIPGRTVDPSLGDLWLLGCPVM